MKFKTFIAESDKIDYKTFNLSKLYDDLNRQVWDNRLPKFPVKFEKLPKRTLGHCEANSLRTPLGKKTLIPNTIIIKIAPLNFPLNKLKMILAHEMIHAELFLKDDFKTNHDGEFERLRREYSKKLGIEISVSDTIDLDVYDSNDLKEFGYYIIEYSEPPTIRLAIISKKSAEELASKLKTDIEKNIKLGLYPKISTATLIIARSPLEHKFKISRIDPARTWRINMYSVSDIDLKSIKPIKTLFKV